LNRSINSSFHRRSHFFTNHLAARAFQHRNGGGSSFTARYAVKTLVWYEHHSDIRQAIAREKHVAPARHDVDAVASLDHPTPLAREAAQTGLVDRMITHCGQALDAPGPPLSSV
jgi:hypothetical protein